MCFPALQSEQDLCPPGPQRWHVLVGKAKMLPRQVQALTSLWKAVKDLEPSVLRKHPPFRLTHIPVPSFANQILG